MSTSILPDSPDTCKQEAVYLVLHERSGRQLAAFYHADQAAREARFQQLMGTPCTIEHTTMTVHTTGRRPQRPPLYIMPAIASIGRGRAILDHFPSTEHMPGRLGVFGQVTVVSETVIAIDLNGILSCATDDLAEMLPTSCVWFEDGLDADGRYTGVTRDGGPAREWRVQVDRRSWEGLMQFLATWQLWWKQPVTAWMEMRCSELNACEVAA